MNDNEKRLEDMSLEELNLLAEEIQKRCDKMSQNIDSWISEMESEK